MSATPQTRQIDEVRIAGVTLSSIIFRLFSSETSATVLPLRGHYEETEQTTDAGSVTTSALIITGESSADAADDDSSFKRGELPVGAASLRRYSPHKPSFSDETWRQRPQDGILLVMTAQHTEIGTLQVKYTLYHGRRSLPLAIDNIVMSSDEFTVARNLRCRYGHSATAGTAPAAGQTVPVPQTAVALEMDGTVAALDGKAAETELIWRAVLAQRERIAELNEAIAALGGSRP